MARPNLEGGDDDEWRLAVGGRAGGEGRSLPRLEHEGAYATPMSPEQFSALIDSERERWGALIRRTGMKPD